MDNEPTGDNYKQTSPPPRDRKADNRAIAGNNSNNNNSANPPVDARGGAQRRQVSSKGKPIAHRSQSSPSSLTTHKFGLKPTPSPPRLIIDHQTGDIIESYPEQPVYLRTYQPLDDNYGACCDTSVAEDDYSTSNALDLDSSQHQLPALSAAGKPLAGPTSYSNFNLQQQQQLYLSSGDEDSTAVMGRADGAKDSRRAFIPPPHAANNKVYFAPPMPSAGHLFHHDDYDHFEQPADRHRRDESSISGRSGERDRLQMRHQAHPQSQSQSLSYPQPEPEPGLAIEAASTSGQLQQSPFKRAISKLNESSPRATTDIALVTHADGEGGKQNEIKIMSTPKLQTAYSRQLPAAYKQSALSGQLTSAASLSAPKAAHQSTSMEANHLKLINERPQDDEPHVESFGLYSFCYCFRILLTILLSSLIIYLLLVPLNLDCTKYRPTYMYVSLIIASVNLICVTIFTLFWYCSGVTRTLYSNISSSAFIITIYSILVAINLAIAIIFFLIGTCHFQRLINTPQSTRASFGTGTGDYQAATAQAYVDSNLWLEREMSGPLIEELVQDRLISRGHEVAAHSILARRSAEEPGDADQTINAPGTRLTEPAEQHPALSAADPLAAYAMSPIEAAWEFTKEQAELLLLAFHRFLLHYDLRFIGALHALCAICFQYLAIKVAVVRSYFCCSPVGGGAYV